MKAGLRHDIQGLRALAVLAVVVFHVNARWLPGGYIGVDVFFVISGFLITGILLRNKDEGSFRFGSFYANRMARIVPAYAAMLLITALVSAVLLLPHDFAYFWSSLKRAALFASNNHFAGAGDYFSPDAHEWPLLHTWSLGVEMQFYLLLPLLVLVVPSRYLLPVLLLLIVALTLTAQHWLLLPVRSATTYYSLWARVPEFLVGAVAAGLKPTTDKSGIQCPGWLTTGALAALMSCLVLMDKAFLFPGLSALLPCVATAVLLWGRQGHAQRWLSTPVMVWLGERSYSLYLWHWPVLALWRYGIEEPLMSATQVALYGISVFLLADASHRWIETPLRQRPYRRKTAWIAGALAVTTLVSMAGSRVLNIRIVDPPPMEMTRYAPADQICHGKVLAGCLRGTPSGDTPLLLIGDSHAAQLNLFADEIGRSQNLSLVVLSASSCVPIPGFDVDRIAEYARKECKNQILEANAAASKANTILIAGKWTYQTASERFMNAMDDYLTRQTGLGKQVIVLAQVPPLLSDPLRARRWVALGLPSHAPSLDPNGVIANKRISALVDKHPGVKFWDMTSDSSFEIDFRKNSSLLYSDRHHLNEIGARLLGRNVASGFRDKLQP